MNTIKIQYNGTRFPRVANLRKGGKRVFLFDRTIIEFEEYDALHLLTLNNRLTPIKWEFTVVSSNIKAEKKKEKTAPPPPIKEDEPESISEELEQEEEDEPGEEVDLNSLTKSELMELCEENGIEYKANARKADLIKLLEE